MPKLPPVNADMRRAKERCQACARLQLQIETGQYVPGAVADGELHAAPRSDGRRAQEAFPHGSGTPSEIGNSLAQHECRPQEIICNHCLCSSDVHDNTGPNGQRCCGAWRESPRETSCDWCRASDECRAWSQSRACPTQGSEAGCALGKGEECTHCTCPCASRNPHKFDDRSTWVAQLSVYRCATRKNSPTINARVVNTRTTATLYEHTDIKTACVTFMVLPSDQR